MTKLIAIVLAFALVAGSAADPGVVFEVEVIDHATSPPDVGNLVIKVEGSKVAIPFKDVSKSSESGAMIFRGDRGEAGEVIIVSDDSRSYMVLDDASIKEMGERMSEVEKMIEDQLKNLPPEQQEAARKAMAGGMGGMGMPTAPTEPPEVEVVNTGEKATRAGYPCVKYIVKTDGVKTAEMWVADWDEIEGASEARAAFTKMGAFFADMVQEVVPNAPGADQLGPFGFAKFDVGFPVVTLTFDEAGNLTQESSLKSASRQTIDPAEFEPPSGYKRMSMGME